MRPVIGVTLGDGDQPGVHAVRQDYVRSVEQSGAVPVVLPPVSPEDVPALLDRLDGVLLSGGVDVDPALYGQEPHPRLGRVNRRRDDFELALVAKHAFAVAQAFHSYYQKPKYSVLYAETEDLRAGRTLVVDTFVRQMEVLLGLLGIPVPERM